MFNSKITLKNYITRDSAENVHQSKNHKKKIVPSNTLVLIHFHEVSLNYCHCNVFISIMSFTMIKVVLSLIQAVKHPVFFLLFLNTSKQNLSCYDLPHSWLVCLIAYNSLSKTFWENYFRNYALGTLAFPPQLPVSRGSM